MYVDVDDHLASEMVNGTIVDRGKEIGLGLVRKYRFQGVGQRQNRNVLVCGRREPKRVQPRSPTFLGEELKLIS